MPAWSAGSPCRARTEAAGEVCHGQQPESSQPRAKRLSFGMSWHVVLAAIGTVLDEPSGRTRSPAFGACDRTGIPLRVENRPALFSGLWCS
jgi:hypothetical protein